MTQRDATPEELALALARKIVDQMFDARFYMNARGAALEASLLAIQEATELTARFIEPDSGFLTDEELRNAAKADALRRNDHLKGQADG